MRSRYNTFELCNALKPFLLQHLMSHTEYRKFCYFDSDIYIFSPLQGDVWDELDSCAVLLTPHLCEFPDNNLELLWRDLAVLQHGVYNGGFIGIRRCPEAQELLRWWASRLIEGGYKNLAKGMNCDQRWLDLVPGFAPSVRICRHAGVNAAYWNMHERHFKTVDGQHSVNGQQLRFFHFSGYSHVDSGAITKNWTKFTFENRPDVKPIFDEYRKHFDSISKLAATTTRHARGPEAAPRSPRKSSLIKALAQRLRSGWTNNLYRRRP
jgi:hypothetical protein